MREQNLDSELGIGFGALVALGIAIGLAIGGSGCASVHPGNPAMTETHNDAIPLKVSAQLADSQDKAGYALIYVTLENTGDRWVKISEANVLISPEDAGKVSVVVGKDLEDWASAMKTSQELKKRNKSIIEAILLGAGGVTALATGGRGSAAASIANDIGLATVAGTGGYMLADAAVSSKEHAERPARLPENHLCEPFTVPSQLFIRRWVLLNKPASENLHSLRFEIKTAEGQVERYDVQL